MFAVRAAEPMSWGARRAIASYIITCHRPTSFTRFFVASEYGAGGFAIVAGIIYFVGSHFVFRSYSFIMRLAISATVFNAARGSAPCPRLF